MAAFQEPCVRRFAKVSSDCVLQAAQNLGIQTSNEVSEALVDDVSFRVRQIADTACQFMNHAKRKRLTTDDFDKALKWSRIEPVHGHQTGEAAQFTSTQNSSVFIVQDSELDLRSTALDNPNVNTNHQPFVEASWVTIEGTSVNSKDTQDGTSRVVELKREPNESNEKYMSVLMEALTGDKEELRLLALTDLQKNPAIANILPDLVAYLQETLTVWKQFNLTQLTHLLKLSLGLVQNPHLLLEPYLPTLYPGLKAILLDSTHLSGYEGHWNIRELCAAVVATLFNRCSPANDCALDLQSSLQALLISPDPPLPVLYTAVFTLCYQTDSSLATILYPRIDSLVNFITGILDGKASIERRGEALRVYEALLLSAELLLTRDSVTEAGSAVTHSPLPEARPSSAKETGNLFSGTSFGLTEEPTDMEIEQPSPHVRASHMTKASDHVTLSMYEHLTELFGEGLYQKLSTNPRFKTELPSPQKPTLPEVKHSRSSHTSAGLLNFLSEEGFKPLKIELPLTSLPRPPKRNRWTLVLPRTRLPVAGNVLESRAAGSRPRGHQGTDSVSKGSCASYRRHNSRSGSGSGSVQSMWL